MRRFVWCLIVLVAFGWTGFMAVYIASIIPDPEVVGAVQAFVWVVFAGIVLMAFWMLPMLCLWCLATLVKPREYVIIEMRHIPEPEVKPDREESPQAEVIPLFCQSVGMPKAERRIEPYQVEGQIVAFRPREQRRGN
ncbi:MAG: hypothetical protein K0S94_2810 [Nitrospira sp.]|jgi:hypothetical protein|nr:hypothetical protein [Nitrospira sp.]